MTLTCHHSNSSRYSNALASTDPRVVVAQPSLSQLFEGFKQQLEIVKGQGKIPILNNNTFVWREEVLPQQVTPPYPSLVGVAAPTANISPVWLADRRF
jgi:hypothetical protein